MTRKIKTLSDVMDLHLGGVSRDAIIEQANFDGVSAHHVVRCDGSSDAATDARWQIAAHYAREDAEAARREAWERGVE